MTTLGWTPSEPFNWLPLQRRSVCHPTVYCELETSKLHFRGSVNEVESGQAGSPLVMAQDTSSSSGEDCFGEKLPCCSDTEALSRGDKEYDDILELNQFDGLPYSSRFYKLLRERKELPVWKAKCEFMDTLAKGRFVSVTGSAKTGRSSQVSTVKTSDTCHGKYCTFSFI